MKTHSRNYKNAIKNPGRMIKNIITYTINGEFYSLDDDNLFSVNPNFKGSILKSVMKELDINSKIDIPLNTILNYQFGLKINGGYEYLNFGNYVVYKSEKQEDTNSYKITCYDKMLYSMIDYESMGITYPISIRNYINAICNKLGLTFKNVNDTFVNYNKQIQNELYLDSNGRSLGYTFRDVLDELAQVTASTICINEEDDELEIRYINDTNDTINGDYLKNINVNFGKKYGPINSIVLTRSAGSDSVYLRDEQSVIDNGLCEMKITDNQIMNFNDRSDYLPDILYTLNGLEYYLNDFASTGITYYNLCDKYNIEIDDITYPCVMFNDEINITQGLEENVYTEMPNESETDYTKADKTDRKINQTYLIVDKQNQTIQSVISQVNNQNNKISQITQTIDELNSKISDVIDITTSAEDTDGQVELSNINESEPIEIKIRPINENIGLLYPSNNLFPSSSLYLKSKILRFIRTYTEEGVEKTQNIDYILPGNLLYYNEDVYDEFYLNYDSQVCQIIKRCGYNSNGEIVALQNEEIIPYSYPTITLGTGDYTVTLLGYSNAYIMVRLMASNIYTTQFATKVEMNSVVNQTAEEINSEVSRKVGNDEIISKINQSAEAITISANKINIAGTITAINNNTSTTINGNKIATGTLSANKITSGTLNASNVSIINLNANNINTGTLTAAAINLGNGKFSVTTNGYLTATSGIVGGWSLSSSGISAGNSSLLADGRLNLYPSVGGVYRINNGVRLNASSGVQISSNGGSPSFNSTNIDILGLYGASVYLACRYGNEGSERSSVTCANGALYLASAGAIYANGVQIGGSSSKATKENIINLSNEKKNELYDLIKNIPLKQYDYKEQYGKKINYGFIIEDIENTKLNTLLHIVQNKENKNIKNYSTEDLARLELVVIQELMKKVEKLEGLING